MEWIAALIGAGASMLGGWASADAAQKASATQADAANRAIDLQAATVGQARADAAPWLTAGRKGLDALLGELGLQKTNSDGTAFQSKFTAQPGYQFMQQEGEKGVVRNLKALGMSNSGAALKALTRFNSGLANQTYQQYLDRLSGVSTGGQSTASTGGAQSIAAGQGIGQTMMDAGAARASGYVGSANAWVNALGNTANSVGKALGSGGNNWNFLGA